MANVLERALRMGEGRILRRLKNYADAVNHLEEDFKTLSDDDLKHETVELRERYSNGGVILGGEDVAARRSR